MTEIQPKAMSALVDFTVLDTAPTPKKSPRRLTMMSALATGWLPWGIEWHPSLTFSWDYSEYNPATGREPRPCGYEFILSCGHTMKPKEAQAFVSAGLLTAGTDRHGREALVITDDGRTWLARNWPS